MSFYEVTPSYVESYLNAQLGSLWNNAVACLEKLESSQSLEKPNLYSVSLAKYTPKEPFAQVMFDRPTVKIICNHEILLKLRITRYTAPSGVDEAQTLESETLSSEPIDVLLRVPYQISGLECETPRIQGQDLAINPRFVVLGLSKSYHPSPVPPPKEAVDRFPIQMEDFLHGYFELLQNAGHHILHYLPDFNGSNIHHSSDFCSAVTNTTAVSQVWGIPTEKINEYLFTAWRNALILSSILTETLSTGPSLSLSQYHNSWSLRSSDSSLVIGFSAPTVLAVCEQEVLISFNIDEVEYGEHNDDSSTCTFTGGRVVFLSTVKDENTREGGRILSLTRDTFHCVYMDQLSEFPQPVDARPQDNSRFQNLLKDLFVAEYLPCLTHEDLDTLFDSDVIPLPDTDTEDSQNADQSSPDGQLARSNIRKEVSTTSNVGGYDTISAVSEAAINQNFYSNWQRSDVATDTDSNMLSKWAHDEVFGAEFAPMTVRLLSNERAVVTIHLKSGYLKVGQDGFDADAESYSFSEWQLAFEVTLGKCRHNKIPGISLSWITRFKEWITRNLKKRGKSQDRDFCHIYADFKDVEFLPAFSHFTGLFPSLGNILQGSLAKVKALVAHIREEYLPKLMRSGYHILHTVSVCKPGKGKLGELRDFHFRVTSDTVVTSKTLRSRSHHSDPVIIIAGMNTDKPLPDLPLDYPWLIPMVRAMDSGAVCLSNRSFLLPEVLTRFSAVNAMTTMTSSFTKVDKAEWDIKLVPWAEDPLRKGRVTDFCREKGSSEDGGLRYVWNHQEHWEAKETGLSCLPPQEDQYTVSCRTENHLIIPTNYADDISIRIEGRVELHMDYCGSQDSRVAQASAAVMWSADILMTSTQTGGLQVSTRTDELIYKRNDPESDQDHIPENVLRKYFTCVPDLSTIANVFRKFEEPWEFSYISGGTLNLVNPSFNTHGDLLFELRLTAAPDPSLPSVSTPEGALRGDLSESDGNTPQRLQPS